MTVGELRELLVRFDPNMRVVTAGFDEGGVEDITTVEERKIKFDVRPNGRHVGPHDEDPCGIPAVWIDF